VLVPKLCGRHRLRVGASATWGERARKVDAATYLLPVWGEDDAVDPQLVVVGCVRRESEPSGGAVGGEPCGLAVLDLHPVEEGLAGDEGVDPGAVGDLWCIRERETTGDRLRRAGAQFLLLRVFLDTLGELPQVGHP